MLKVAGIFRKLMNQQGQLKGNLREGIDKIENLLYFCKAL